MASSPPEGEADAHAYLLLIKRSVVLFFGLGLVVKVAGLGCARAS
ncbi:hypothetical protein [Streptomyces chartreusis]